MPLGLSLLETTCTLSTHECQSFSLFDNNPGLVYVVRNQEVGIICCILQTLGARLNPLAPKLVDFHPLGILRSPSVLKKTRKAWLDEKAKGKMAKKVVPRCPSTEELFIVHYYSLFDDFSFKPIGSAGSLTFG